MTTEQMDAIDDANRLKSLGEVMEGLVRDAVFASLEEVMSDLPDSMNRAVVEGMVMDAMIRVLGNRKGTQ